MFIFRKTYSRIYSGLQKTNMKKKQLELSRKLVLNKMRIAALENGEARYRGGGPESLACPSFDCTIPPKCGPNGSAGCQSVFQCPGETTPGQNFCVPTAAPTFIVTCPPTPVTTQCTIGTNGCAISN